MTTPARVKLLNRISLSLAIIVVAGSTAYVVTEQQWFESAVSADADGGFAFVDVIRNRLSHHR
jgi:hypothetical protein